MRPRDLIALAFGIGYRAGGGSTLGAFGLALGVRVLVNALQIPAQNPPLPQETCDRAKQLGALAYDFHRFSNPDARGASFTGRGN